MAGCCASNEPVHNAGIIGAAPEERGDRGGSESAELPPSVTCQGCVRPGQGDGDGRLVSRTGTQTGLASGTGVAQRRGSTAGLPRCRPAGLWGAFYRTNLGLTRGAPWVTHGGFYAGGIAGAVTQNSLWLSGHRHPGTAGRALRPSVKPGFSPLVECRVPAALVTRPAAAPVPAVGTPDAEPAHSCTGALLHALQLVSDYTLFY